jgi:TolA-binding protein
MHCVPSKFCHTRVLCFVVAVGGLAKTPDLTLRFRLSANTTTTQTEADNARLAHEKQVQQRCDALIGQYRSIAEQATAQVQQLRQQHQVEKLNAIKQSEEERSLFETQVMERAQNVIRTAKTEAKAAT